MRTLKSKQHYLIVLLTLFFFIAGTTIISSVYAEERPDESLDDEASAFEEDDAFGDDEAFGDESSSYAEESLDEKAVVINGFVEIERGARLGSSEQHDETWVMANERVRLKTSHNMGNGSMDLKLDFISDGVTHRSEIDIREARIRYSLTNWMDLSVGRQVSTWGVGDLIFVNDLFPKNWVNMFTGRDMESLKDPAEALRVTTYMGDWTWDVVWTPEFSPDTTPTGCRFSVYDPNTGMLIANPQACETETLSAEQNNHVENGELATRLQTTIGSQKMAIYGYSGFWKNPKGIRFNSETKQFEPFYPRMSSIGVSSEGQLGPGIFAFEAGHYNSFEDHDGTDPLIENSTTRVLLGYKYDIGGTQSIGVQGMSDIIAQYEEYENNLMPGQSKKDETRNTMTLRFTQTAQQETLRMSLFGFHRPQDRDCYLRYWVNKRLDDHFDVTFGGNVFSGQSEYLDRDFGMFRDDDNVYTRLKYIF